MSFKYDYPRRHAITVEEFMRMGEAHVFGYEARLELIEGEIIEMAPISNAHASVVCTLDALLRKMTLGSMISVRNPLVLGELSMPQPDLMLLRPRGDRYYNSHPVAADALLVVQVAGNTLSYDVEVKVPLYFRTGVAEVWVVNIDRRELHVFRGPGPAHRILTMSESAAVAGLPGAALPVSALFTHL